MSEQIRWKPLSPFGAELDVRLNGEISSALSTALEQMFRRHYLLVIPGQDLSEEQQKRIMAILGPVPEYSDDLVSNDPAAGNQGSIKLAFHSDLSFAPEPDLGLSLFAMDVIDGASATRIASGIHSYAALPKALKTRIADLQALNVWSINQTRRNRLAELRSSDPRCAHPVVWPHPVTAEPVLYVTEMQTDCILGLSESESEALIAELFDYLYSPANVVTHYWRTGDLVIMDNRALQHGRDDVSNVGLRTLRRSSIARRSFFEQFPQFRTGESGFVDERHAPHMD